MIDRVNNSLSYIGGVFLSKNCVVILAAGDGKRMKSDKPKVLCEVLFRPMLRWVLNACEKAEAGDVCVVKGKGAELLDEYLGDQYQTVMQQERLGTGHALMQAKAFIEAHNGGDLLVLCGDAPFVDAETIRAAYEQHLAEGNAATVITAELSAPTGYGRMLRNQDRIVGIVEEKDATDDQKKIQEVNSGAYWFRIDDMLSVVSGLTNENNQKEYYLTQFVPLLLEAGKRVGGYRAKSADVVMGANDRAGLLALNRIATERVIRKHLENGVEFTSTDGVIIMPEVEIGQDTVILQGTILKGKTKIGNGCTIGPNSLVEDSVIGNDTVFNASQCYESVIHDHVKIGPFCHIRPNSEVMDHVKIGDFVEVKNSTIGEYTAVSHLTYVGDSDVGRNVNFGCGVVTVNYDGVRKHRCVIEDNAFIGCNTNLVAPVHIGNGAYTGAGSTITNDVPVDALGIARARQTNIDGFAAKKLEGRKRKV